MPARVSASVARSMTGSDSRSRPPWLLNVRSGAPSSAAMARASTRWIKARGCARHASRRTTRLVAALRQPVAEADLQALDGFLHRAAERQAQAREVGLVQHYAHVLFRPRHAGEIRALVHRPVLRARMMQRRAQLFGVDAERFAQAQPLVVRRGAGPQDQVVHHLGDLAGAGGTQMKDVGGKGAERRPAGLEGRLVPRAEDEELAGYRGAL